MLLTHHGQHCMRKRSSARSLRILDELEIRMNTVSTKVIAFVGALFLMIAAPLGASAADLIVEDIAVGTGAEAVPGKLVVVHYTGTLTDGKVFDSSRQRGPFSFPLGQGAVIQGWEQGIQGMKVGGQRKLTIPPELGYGSRGIGPIPPNSTLIFDVELLDVK